MPSDAKPEPAKVRRVLESAERNLKAAIKHGEPHEQLVRAAERVREAQLAKLQAIEDDDAKDREHWEALSHDEILAKYSAVRAPAVIEFYSASAEYGELSNFALYPIELRGERWPTSEHFFQAHKFANKRDREDVRAANTPMIAAQIGRDRKRKLRRDWESVKIGVMREAVEAKFRQHADLRGLLLGTGEARLVEHTDADNFWGDGGDGRGRNELGRILMAVRSALRAEHD